MSDKIEPGGEGSDDVCRTVYECAQLALDAARAAQRLATRAAPPGAIVAFHRTSAEGCPDGWTPYLPAQNMFLRGINPKTPRKPGEKEGQSIQKHNHPIDRGKMGCDGEDVKGKLDRGGGNGCGPGIELYVGDYGDKETRPANVAVLFCIRGAAGAAR